MRKDVQDLIDMAQANIDFRDTNARFLGSSDIPYFLAAIAQSLQAMVKMFASDYERSFPGENDEP